MSATAQVSTRALVRPFADCSDLLEAKLLTRIAPGEDYTLAAHYAELPPALEGFELRCKLEFSAAEIAERWDVPAADLALVAVLTVPALRLSERISSFGSSQMVEGAELRVDDARIRTLPTGTSFTVTFSVVLLRDHKYRPGSPWLPGHWAGNRAIQFNVSPHGRSFNIVPITPDEFVRRGLPKETFYFVQCDDVAVDREAFQRDVTVFIRDDCHSALASGGSSPVVDAIYKQMEADIVAQIASRALRDATEATCAEDTVQAAILKRLKKHLGMPVEAMARMVQDEPERFRAKVQGMCGLGSTLAKTNFS